MVKSSTNERVPRWLVIHGVYKMFHVPTMSVFAELKSWRRGDTRSDNGISDKTRRIFSFVF